MSFPFAAGAAAAVVLIVVGIGSLLLLGNLLKLIIALQIAAKGVIIALILAGRASGQLQLAQSLAATFLLIDTLVAVIGLALAVQMQRTCGTLDLRHLTAVHDPPSSPPD